MDIKLAISRSGHDKDCIYVIIKEEAETVYLADGRLKPIEKPKKKNKKHIQVIKKLPKEITEVLAQEDFRNEGVKRAIKLYKARSQGALARGKNVMEYQEEITCQKQM